MAKGADGHQWLTRVPPRMRHDHLLYDSLTLLVTTSVVEFTLLTIQL